MIFFLLQLFLIQASSCWINHPSLSNVNNLKISNNKLLIITDGGVCIEEDTNYNIINNSYGLIDNDVRDAVLDTSGYLYAATKSGLSVFSEDMTENLNLTSYIQGIPHGILNTVTVRNDSLWLGGNDGGWLWNTKGDPLNFNPSDAKKILSNNLIITFNLKGDSLYIGSDREVIVIYIPTLDDTGSYTHITGGLGSTDTVHSIEFNRDTLWIGTNNGAAYLSTDSFIFTSSEYCYQVKSISDTVYMAAYDNRNIRQWMNGNWVILGPNLIAKPVSIIENFHGDIIVGTKNRGNFSLSQNQWEYSTPPSLWQGGVTTAVMLPNGTLGAVHGIASTAQDAVSIKYPDGSWEIIYPLNNGSWGSPRFILPYEDTAFVVGTWGDPGGLAFIYLNDDSIYIEKIMAPISLTSQPISSMHVDSEQNVWCTIFDNDAPYIFCYRPNISHDSAWISYFSNNFIYTYSMYRIVDGRMVFGTAHLNSNGFVCILNPSDSTTTSQLSGLAGNDINSIDAGEGETIWVASTGGIDAINTSLDILSTLTTNSTSGGLLNNRIVAVEYIKGNGLWAVCENSGVSHRKTDGSWESFNSTMFLAGQPTTDNRGGIYYQSDSNLIIIPTKNGISIKKIEIEDDIETDNITIYPNPWMNNGSLRVISDGNGIFYMYSLDGVLVLEKDIPSNGFLEIQQNELQHFGSGLYYIVTKSDEFVKKGRLVILR